MAMDDAIAQAEALRAQLEAEAKGKPPTTPAPAPGATVPPEGQMSPVEHAEIIRQRGQEGRLPTESQLAGKPEPVPDDARTRAGGQLGIDRAVSNVLRYIGPYIGMPETYGPVDSALHGATMGAGDVARGYQRDIITGQPWGTGAGEVKTARDEFATQYPGANIAGNVVGGAVMPLPGIGYATKAIEAIPSAVGKIGASLGLGAGLGGTTGAIGGAIDEAPAGAAAAAEGAKHGATMGAALGTALPAAISLGAAGLRGARDFFGPQFKGGREATAGRQLLDAAKDPTKVQEVAEAPPVQGPPMPPGGTVTSDDPAWTTGPRNLRPAEQQRARIAEDQARVDPNAGVQLPGQEAGMPARPTVGQITDDPGIQDLENRLVAGILKKDPNKWTPAEQDLARKTQAQSEARTAALQGQADPVADPYNVKVPLETAQRNLATTQEAQTAAALQRGADLATSQETATQAAQRRLQTEQARLGRDLTAEERGDLIRGETAAAKTASKAEVTRLSEAIDPDGTTTSNQGTTAAAARDITKSMRPTERAMEGEEAAIFDIAGMGGTNVPLADTLALRSRITDEVRRIQRDPNADQRSARRLTMLRQELDGTLEQHIDPDVAARYRERQDAARTQAETFKNSTVGDILQSGPNTGGYQMLPEQVAGRVIQNNTTAEAYLAAGGTPETLRGALVDDLFRFAKGRPLTDEMLTTWRGNRQGALRSAPGLADEVSNVGQAQRAIDDLTRTQKAETIAQTGEMTALAQAQKAERNAFEDGSIGKVLKGDPGPQIASMLSGNNAVPDLMLLKGKIAGDPAAEAGMKRAVINFLTSNRFIDAQNGQINPRVFRGFLNDKGPALEIALGEDGMKVLRAIDADLQRSRPGSPVMAGANKGGTPSSYASLFRAVMEGKRGDLGEMISPPMLVGAAMVEPHAAAAGIAAKTMAILRSRGINGVNDVLAEAVQNPAFARAIMMKATPDNMPLAERALQAALQAGRQGATVGYDYGRAGERQRQDVRRRLLEPVP